MKTIKRLFIFICLFGLFFFTGCSKKEEKTNKFDDCVLESQNFIYDGTEHKLEVKNCDKFDVTYTNNNKTEVGKYYVTAKVSDGKSNKELKGIMIIDNEKDENFEKFTKELFVELFEDDQMSVNFFFDNPSNYDIPHYEALLPHASIDSWDSEEDEVKDLLDELKEFDYDNLSSEEKDTYDIIKRYFDYYNNITENMSYMTNAYLGSYLGLQANLPLELDEYKFRNEQDIKDFLNYLKDSEEAFKSYYEFSVKQAQLGYGLTDITIDNVISQCNDFVEIKNNNYLVKHFNTKIDELTFIDDTLKATYKAEAKNLIENDLTNAYDYLAKNLVNLYGKSTNKGGLANFTDGKKYYELMFNNVIGYEDMKVTDAIDYVDKKISSVYAEIMKCVLLYQGLPKDESNKFINSVSNGTPYFSTDNASDVLKSFEEYSKKFVPSLDVIPDITVKLVDESSQDNFSPAAYFISPIDCTNKESIYLNPKYTSDYNYIFTTLAHEGYPGHLYQNVYTKSLDINNIRRVIKNDAYCEGWATYTELYAYNFVENYTGSGLQLALKYLKYNDILNGLLTVRMDMGIHYEGWTINQMLTWCNNKLGEGSFELADLKDTYDQLAEIPTNSVQYFIGYYLIMDMQDETIKVLGDNFNIIEFNKVVLDCGCMPLEMVKEKVNEYIKDQKFLLSIE